MPTSYRDVVTVHQESVDQARLFLRLTGDEFPVFVGRTLAQAEGVAVELSMATGVRWLGASAHGNVREGIGDHLLLCYDTRLSPEVVDSLRTSRLRHRGSQSFVYPAPVPLDVS